MQKYVCSDRLAVDISDLKSQDRYLKELCSWPPTFV